MSVTKPSTSNEVHLGVRRHRRRLTGCGSLPVAKRMASGSAVSSVAQKARIGQAPPQPVSGPDVIDRTKSVLISGVRMVDYRWLRSQACRRLPAEDRPYPGRAYVAPNRWLRQPP